MNDRAGDGAPLTIAQHQNVTIRSKGLIVCPYCDSSDVRPSRLMNPIEALRLFLLDHTAAENAGPVLENKLSIQALVAPVAGYFGIIVGRWMLARKQVVMDLIAPTALLTDTLNRCRREKYAQKFSTRSTISNHHKMAFRSISPGIGQRQLREALAGSQRELGNTARQID